jgi:hypothetical protein
MDMEMPLAFYRGLALADETRWGEKGGRVSCMGERKTYNPRKHLFQILSCTLCFGFPSIETILELKKRLTDGVGEGDPCGIDKGDIAYAPALCVTRSMARLVCLD